MNYSALPRYHGEGVTLRFFRIPSHEIAFLTSLVEAHEGIGLVRTLDSSRGLIECWVASDWIDFFDDFMNSLSRHFPIESLDRDEL